MKTPTLKERAALAQADTIGQAEANRADWWELLPLQHRQRAVGVAGMPKERAALPIATFNDADRERVRLAIAVHVGQMELIAACMAGRNTTARGWLH